MKDRYSLLVILFFSVIAAVVIIIVINPVHGFPTQYECFNMDATERPISCLYTQQECDDDEVLCITGEPDPDFNDTD